jgi:hypothetical protein
MIPSLSYQTAVNPLTSYLFGNSVFWVTPCDDIFVILLQHPFQYDATSLSGLKNIPFYSPMPLHSAARNNPGKGVVQSVVNTMLGGPLLTTAWCVLRLRMKARPPAMEGGCEHADRDHGRPTRGGPPAWGLGVGITTSHRKKN